MCWRNLKLQFIGIRQFLLWNVDWIVLFPSATMYLLICNACFVITEGTKDSQARNNKNSWKLAFRLNATAVSSRTTWNAIKHMSHGSWNSSTFFVSSGSERGKKKRARSWWSGCDILIGDPERIPSSRRRGWRRVGCRRWAPCRGGARRRAPARGPTPGPGAPSRQPAAPPSADARGGALSRTDQFSSERKEAKSRVICENSLSSLFAF